jgi:hypothetical protein
MLAHVCPGPELGKEHAPLFAVARHQIRLVEFSDLDVLLHCVSESRYADSSHEPESEDHTGPKDSALRKHVGLLLCVWHLRMAETRPGSLYLGRTHQTGPFHHPPEDGVENLLVTFVQKAARWARQGKRLPAFAAEAASGAVLSLAARALHPDPPTSAGGASLEGTAEEGQETDGSLQRLPHADRLPLKTVEARRHHFVPLLGHD